MQDKSTLPLKRFWKMI